LAREGTRERILEAAGRLARQLGPGNISLEAVAAEAGISKGGLLYHFPSKDRLLRAIVGRFVEQLEQSLEAEPGADRPNGLMAAYVRQLVREREECLPPPTGLLAALAEQPDLLDPVRRFENAFVERARQNATDPQMAIVAFLIVHAVRSMKLFGAQPLTETEIGETLDWVLERLDAPAA
jgi:AcrR family transcriptional regulator